MKIWSNGCGLTLALKSIPTAGAERGSVGRRKARSRSLSRSTISAGTSFPSGRRIFTSAISASHLTSASARAIASQMCVGSISASDATASQEGSITVAVVSLVCSLCSDSPS